MMILEATYIIQEQDIDELGHMNYMNYLKYLEDARFKWFEQVWLSLEELVAQQKGIVVLKFDMSYLKEVRLDETITIRTIPTKLGNKSFTLKQAIYNEHGDITNEATFIFTIMDLIERKSIPVPNEIKKQFTEGNSGH
ncbi:thioesterase family protein [Lysinibacillus sp. KU-BSD001]|uniref:acyl-CoA thioesterase n=1 Tax=Lysinibacillus sp. KU-BSD001 TaxID=3141328 RepID=UPI0036EBE9FB